MSVSFVQAQVDYSPLTSYITTRCNVDNDENAVVVARFNSLAKYLDATKAHPSLRHMWLHLILRTDNISVLDAYFKLGLGNYLSSDRQRQIREDEILTQLCYCFKGGVNLERAKRLIKAGVNLNATSSNRLHVFPDYDELKDLPDFEEAVKLFIDNGAIVPCDAQSGNRDKVQFCLDHGADINVKDVYGYTELSKALLSDPSRGGGSERLAVVKLLLQRGAARDPLIVNDDRAKDFYSKDDAKGLCDYMADKYQAQIKTVSDMILRGDIIGLTSHIHGGGFREILLSSNAGVLQKLYESEKFGYPYIKKLILLSYPYYSSIVNKNKKVLFEMALQENDVEIVKDLIAATPDLAPFSQDLYNIQLEVGMQGHHFEFVKEAVSQGANIEYFIGGSDGSSALYWAIEHQDYQTAQFLVRRGADIMAAPNNEEFVLEQLIKNKPFSDDFYDFVESLLERGISPNIGGARSLYSQALQSADIRMLALMKKYGGNMEANALIIDEEKLKNNVIYLSQCLSEGLDQTVLKGSGLNALMIACLCGDMNEVRELIGQGADVNELSGGEIPINVLTCALLYPNIVEILGAAGANLGDASFIKQLVICNQPRILLDIVRKKINFNASKAFAACNPLDRSYVPMLRILLHAGTKVTDLDARGKTMMQEACEWGDLDLFKAAIKAGGVITFGDKGDFSTICQGGHKELLKYTLQNVNHENVSDVAQSISVLFEPQSIEMLEIFLSCGEKYWSTLPPNYVDDVLKAKNDCYVGGMAPVISLLKRYNLLR